MQIESRSFTLGLALAILVVAAADLSVRVLEPRLSGDIANTREFPRQVAELETAPGKRVAAIGNSLIGDGLDADTFMFRWLDGGVDQARAIKMTPDASGIWDWHCIVKYELADSEATPDLLIVGFGWNQLSDQSSLSLTRAFNVLCPAGAIADFSELSGRVGINGWLEMVAVKTSKLYAHRSNIRHRVLQVLIPDYRSMTREVNARAGQGEEQDDASKRPGAELSYRALEQLLGRFSNSDTRVVLVAMPVMNPYAMDERLCEVLESTPHLLIDMRYAVPSSDMFYRDNLHLNEEGARLFSETLATQLRSPRPSMSACPT